MPMTVRPPETGWLSAPARASDGGGHGGLTPKEPVVPPVRIRIARENVPLLGAVSQEGVRRAGPGEVERDHGLGSVRRGGWHRGLGWRAPLRGGLLVLLLRLEQRQGLRPPRGL